MRSASALWRFGEPAAKSGFKCLGRPRRSHLRAISRASEDGAIAGEERRRQPPPTRPKEMFHLYLPSSLRRDDGRGIGARNFYLPNQVLRTPRSLEPAPLTNRADEIEAFQLQFRAGYRSISQTGKTARYRPYSETDELYRRARRAMGRPIKKTCEAKSVQNPSRVDLK